MPSVIFRFTTEDEVFNNGKVARTSWFTYPTFYECSIGPPQWIRCSI